MRGIAHGMQNVFKEYNSAYISEMFFQLGKGFIASPNNVYE